MKIIDIVKWGAVAVGLYVVYVVARPMFEGEGIIDPLRDIGGATGDDAYQGRITLSS